MKNIGIFLIVTLAFGAAFIGLDILLFGFNSIEDEIRKQCIETKISRGYTEDFAKEYCLGPGNGCIEKVYSTDCDATIHCCFESIEEDKKWNYLNYNDSGNPINQQ